MFDSGTTLPLRHFNTSANKRSSKPEARLVPLVPLVPALGACPWCPVASGLLIRRCPRPRHRL